MGIEIDQHLDFPDLGAQVYPYHVPDGLGEELPGLYNTLLSTIDWFEIEDGATATGACILERPRHVLLFHRHGGTIEILNKEAAVAPADVRRACQAVFQAFPDSHRIHLEIMFPPTEVRLPRRALYWTDHMVVELPSTAEAYTASLGKRTRRHLRRSRKLLQQDHAGISVETISPVVECDELIATFVSWKNRRFNATGRTTIWQRDPDNAGQFAELVRRRGEARVTTIDGRWAVIKFLFPVGASMYLLQSSFDPDYLPYSLGALSTYDVACEAAERGFKRVSLLWGEADSKSHLGARPRRATRLSIFRSPTARLRSLDEAKEVALRNLRRNGQREYWRARHSVGRTLRAAMPAREERD